MDIRKILPIAFLFLVLATCITGCSAESETASDEKNVQPYLNITESFYTDEYESGMESRCYIYDLDNKEFVQKGKVPYTSAYPLTLYSNKENIIFYSALSNRGDQLYRDNEGEEEQLTDQFCALNYIFQCGDKLFLAAKYLEKYCIEPFLYDLGTGEVVQVFPDPDDDRFTWSAVSDPNNNKVYFSYYSDNLGRELMSRDNSLGNVEYPEEPPSTICVLDVDTETVSEVYETDGYISGMAADGDYLYYGGAESSSSPDEDFKCYRINIKSGERTELPVPVVITGQMAYWDNILYCLGWKDGIRGIYAVNLDTYETELIHEQEDGGFINGMSLNY